MFRAPRGLGRSTKFRRGWLLGLVTALLVATLPMSAQAASQEPVIINASGGDSAEPGLRIHYGGGQLQVFRNGSPQLHPNGQPANPTGFSYNGIALNLEGAAYLPWVGLIAGTPFSNTGQTGGSASGSGTITGTLDTGIPGFVVDVIIDYTYPNDYFTTTLVIDRAATNDSLKLYHFSLSSQYWVPAFHIESPETVGMSGPGTVAAFRYVAGPDWTGYFAGRHYDPWPLVESGANFDNTITVDGDPKTYGIMWDLGTAAASHSVSYDMIFSDALSLPVQMVAPSAVAGNGSATVTVVSPNDNGSPITGHTVTAGPGNATCSIGPLATWCVVPGLTNGTAYTFTATATNAYGTSVPSPASNSVTPTAPRAEPDKIATGVSFIDIPSGEMAVAASWLASQGIALGCESGTSPRFCPNDPTTRAEVATLLSRALGLPATTVDAFGDDDGHLLEDGLNRAAAAGVFLGCSLDGDVCPDDVITRGELAAVLVRAFHLVSNQPADFADAGDHWAESSIQTIGGLGISIGCSVDGQWFCPEDSGNRGDIALFVYRALMLR